MLVRMNFIGHQILATLALILHRYLDSKRFFKTINFKVVLIFFCVKTTVLAEKVFHLAAGEAQLTALCHMLSLFYQAD